MRAEQWRLHKLRSQSWALIVFFFEFATAMHSGELFGEVIRLNDTILSLSSSRSGGAIGSGPACRGC